jgi:hypothetical protein
VHCVFHKAAATHTVPGRVLSKLDFFGVSAEGFVKISFFLGWVIFRIMGQHRPSFGLGASGDSHLGALWRLWPSKGASYGQLGAFRGALGTLHNPRPDSFFFYVRYRFLGLPTSGFGEGDPPFGPRGGWGPPLVLGNLGLPTSGFGTSDFRFWGTRSPLWS